MEQKELQEKLNNIVAHAMERDDMDIVVGAMKSAVMMLNEADSNSCDDYIESLEGNLVYHNYLTEREAMNILSNFKNQDGSSGAKWRDPELFFKKIDTLDNGMCENAPLYNKWALYVTMNGVFSDHHSTIMRFTEGDAVKYLDMCYNLAVNKLSDVDRPRWVRSYYGLE